MFRRRIRVVTVRDGVVVAELEDDFHHFRVRLGHDGTIVTSIDGEAVRNPWTSCAAAGSQLFELVGMPLSRSSVAVGQHTEVRQNCTHMFDLAGLAVAHAAAGRTQRVYDITVPDRERGSTTVARLERDGEEILAWQIAGTTIVSPEPFAGQPLRGGFIAWATSTLDDETAEAALVLRRACDISMGRLQDLDIYDDPTPLMSFMEGSCYTFRRGTAEVSLRVKGSARDFTDTPELLLPNAPAG